MSLVLRPNVLSLGNHAWGMADWANREAAFPMWTGGPMDLGTQRRPWEQPQRNTSRGRGGNAGRGPGAAEKSWEQWLAWASLSAVDSDPPPAARRPWHFGARAAATGEP
jgi:hypothetical protein